MRTLVCAGLPARVMASWLLGAAVFGAPLHAQRAPADSAAYLSSRADSLADLAVAEALLESVALRQQARLLYGMARDAPAEGMQLHRIGIAYYRLNASDSAAHYFRQAFAVRQIAGDSLGMLRSLNNLGLLHDDAGRSDSALASYHTALRIARALGSSAEQVLILVNVGAAFLRSSAHDSTIAYYGAASVLARDIGDRLSEGEIRNNLAAVYHARGQSEAALATARAAYAIGMEIGDGNLLATSLLNMGVAHNALGAADSALAWFSRSHEEYSGLADRRGLIQVLNNIAVTLDQLGQPDSALAVQLRVATVARELDDPYGESAALQNIGAILYRTGRADSARSYFARTIELKRLLNDRHGLAGAYINMGNAWYLLGVADSALPYLEEAATIGRRIGAPLVVSAALHGQANVHALLGNAAAAFAMLEEDLALSRAAADVRGESQTLASVAGLHHGTGDLTRATAYYDSAAALKLRVARRAGGDHNRLTLAETDTELYDRWSLAWLARAPEIGERVAAFGALAAAERGRAQALLDLMRDSLPESRVAARLEAEGERLASDAVASGATLLSYQLALDTLLIIVVEPDGATAVGRTSVSRDSLGVLVSSFRASLGVDGDATDGRAAPLLERGLGVRAPAAGSLLERGRALARVLLPGATAERVARARELLIVPHGVIALVPFAALPVDTSAVPLGERLPLRYAPSLAVLREAAARHGAASSRGATLDPLVVGNPHMPPIISTTGDTLLLAPLPGAAAESEVIASLLGSTPWLGHAATETAVRGLLPDADIVHLATHGFAYSAEALTRRSFIALAPDDTHDGLLSVGELLDDPALRLRARLVVLSACQTGLGNLKQAEGTIGFQRALLARGAGSALVSLWSVSDDATRLLMSRFYTRWLADDDRPAMAEALRRAQEDVRRTDGYAHPRYWAGFQLVGADQIDNRDGRQR